MKITTGYSKNDLPYARIAGGPRTFFIIDGLDFSHSYFRQADLRGVDLSQANLEGASIHSARIAGAYFPKEISADEILLSFMHGTRMRYRS